MKKGLIIGLILVIGLAGVVFALDGIMTGGNDSEYIVEVDVVEGWNIIAGTIPNEGILDDSEIKPSDIKVIWYYAPNLKKYLQVHPEVDDLFSQVDDDVALTSAMWVYSEKTGRLKYSTLEDYMPLDMRQLYSGWNFVTITPDMYKGTLDGAGYEDEYFSWPSIEGTCNIEKVYFWMPPDQEWDEFSSFRTSKIEEYDFDDFIGLGMIVKVSSDCTLSKPTESRTSPPGLPGGSETCTDSDGGKNYYVKGLTSVINQGDNSGEFSDLCLGNNLTEHSCYGGGSISDIFNCPNGCENGACYYPGYAMRTDKENYNIGEPIQLTLNKGNDGKTSSVDIYLSPAFGNYDNEKVDSKVTVKEAETIIEIPTSSGDSWYVSSGEYMVVICDGGAECSAGGNSNSILININ